MYLGVGVLRPAVRADGYRRISGDPPDGVRAPAVTGPIGVTTGSRAPATHEGSKRKESIMTPPMTRRSVLASTAALTTAAALASCGADDDGNEVQEKIDNRSEERRVGEEEQPESG